METTFSVNVISSCAIRQVVFVFGDSEYCVGGKSMLGPGARVAAWFPAPTSRFGRRRPLFAFQREPNESKPETLNFLTVRFILIHYKKFRNGTHYNFCVEVSKYSPVAFYKASVTYCFLKASHHGV